MPGYVIHLAIAEEYLRKNKEKQENYEEFIKGVIYPDGVKDKSKTHYGEISSRVNLYDFLKENKIDNSFKRGYFLHLLTDYLFYNKYIEYVSDEIYNDYDKLNEEMIKKYKIKLPEEAKEHAKSQKGKTKLISKELVEELIEEISDMQLDDIEKEVKKEPEKWTKIRNLKKIYKNNLDEPIVLPDYNHSILNLITSILKYYKVETEYKTLINVDNILKEKYKNVVLIILDGMGEHILKKASPNGYFEKRNIDCITSVYPSTTTAALTTYYSGKPPYETGWIAWSQYFKEYGRPIDMLKRRQSLNGNEIKNARKDVFKEKLNYQTVFDRIEEASPQIKAYEIMPTYADKKSKRSLRADTVDEITTNIEMLCQNPEEKFILAYSDNPDGILHKYGTESKEAKDFIIETESKIQKMCEKLSKDTLVIISADHGHKNIEKSYSMLDYPEIQECLIMPESLESRVITFWVKEEMKEEFEQEFWLMTKQEFLEKHFLGFGKKHPKIDDFIGNYIALSTSSSIIKLETFLEEAKPVKKSTHCGLSKEEMEVPLIVIRK